MNKYLIEELGSFFSQLSFEHLPQEVVQKAKACLLNSLAATIGGYNVDVSKKAISLVKKIEKANGVSTIFVDGSKTSTFGATFANSVMSCGIAQNDTHMKTSTHIGEIVPQVCFAIGEESSVSGMEFITAMVAGYEVMARVAGAGAPYTIRRGFRNTSVYGTFGSSVAAGKLLGLKERELTSALGYAANFSSGLLECWHEGTTEYAFQSGVSAQNGIMAALIAAEGGSAAKTTLEGKNGFFRAFGGDRSQLHDVVDRLGEKYEIHDVVFRKFPGDFFNQPVIETFLSIMEDHPVREEEIDLIRVRLDPVAANYPGVGNRGPFCTYLDALASCPFVIGALCVFGKIDFESYAKFENQRILEICKRTKVEGEEGRSPLSCFIELRLKTGEILSKDLGLSLSSYSLPLEETVGFFYKAGAPLIGEEKTADVIERILRLENEGNVAAISNLLRKL
jgi:2-methylcitrate dehydratase PrpD